MTLPVVQPQITKSQLDDLHLQIQRVYKQNDMPWIVGFSGGKDSTATLQLVWNAISKLPESERIKKVYVL